MLALHTARGNFSVSHGLLVSSWELDDRERRTGRVLQHARQHTAGLYVADLSTEVGSPLTTERQETDSSLLELSRWRRARVQSREGPNRQVGSPAAELHVQAVHVGRGFHFGPLLGPNGSPVDVARELVDRDAERLQRETDF